MVSTMVKDRVNEGIANNETVETATAEVQAPSREKPKYKRKFGDRCDGRKLKNITPMIKIMPYIMERRSDACNTYADSFDVTRVDEMVRTKVRSGKTNFSLLHIILAAYVRVVSQRPAINRFVSGQKIYARNNIIVNMTVKREMSINAPDTVIKVEFDPWDTLDDVYNKFNETVVTALETSAENSDFDSINKAFTLIPGLLLRFAVHMLSHLDYFGKMPKKILEISPFHGSMIITSMGSLGIKPIYHHIYDFGNLPVFIAYGAKRTVVGVDTKGNITKKKYVDMKVVTDERICDGYYYASCFKLLRKYIENPSLLEIPPEEVLYDCE